MEYRTDDFPRYYFTYYGDVYYGVRIEMFDSNFIVPPYKMSEYREESHLTIEKLRSLGHEIRSWEVVVHEEEKIQYDNSKINAPSCGKVKKMFVLGAGASAFCGYIPESTKSESERISVEKSLFPLGNQLFDDKYSGYTVYYDGVKHLSPIFKISGKGVEDFFEDFWKDLKKSYHKQGVRDIINAQFYLQAIIKQCEANVLQNYKNTHVYYPFIHAIRDHIIDTGDVISLVSFNYDTMLEDALKLEYGKTFDAMDEYMDRENKILLFKPHGSIDWGWRVQNKYEDQKEFFDDLYAKNVDFYQLFYSIIGTPETTLKGIEWGTRSRMKQDLKFTLNKDLIQKTNGGVFYPALLLPYKDKDDFIMPYVHQHLMKDAIKDVEELYVIGWKGNEAVFNNLLKDNKNLKKVVIADPESDVVRNNLENNILHLVSYETCSGFADFVKNMRQYLR
ncbi:MAG: SIR2 family protein [Bacteroidales bacterium]|nr:SIR2 family protein [Bacteroidales bacterium]